MNYLNNYKTVNLCNAYSQDVRAKLRLVKNIGLILQYYSFK